MTNDSSPTITGYHAHIYFDSETEPAAQALRTDIDARFEVVLGRWHHKPVGPHPRWMYQVAFKPDIFADFAPWLALNRRGLVVFLHPETGNSVADHTDHAMWMGDILDLNLSVLTKAS
ncbi:MAG: DOPA 4,5-dioxygenase family protein [Rhodospirillaceae bacterium]|nr:DOPA 4,5-dioxygenase family protein [Rhodospirillaceae bacterium]